MDMKLQGETGSPFPTWDLFVEPLPTGGDIVLMISGVEQDAQEASVAATLILNGIPQLEGVGVDHLGFLAGSVLFGEFDSQIRTALANAGHSDYVPDYNVVNGGLTVTVQKGSTS